MVGYPKYLNTKEDYEFVRKNFPKENWSSAFQSLLDTCFEWFNEGEIVGDGVTDDTHKVVTDEQSGAKYQYVYKENPNCRMKQLGYTEDEIKAILT
nr:MAG TPA: Class III extradiol dioxygenase [Caudoviricetes sp.]